MIIKDDVYNLVVSAYIHNNPKDIPDYRDCIHTYYFSSYGIYLAHRPKAFDMLNTDYILSQFSQNPKEARVLYAEFVSTCKKVTQKEKTYELIDTFVTKKPYEYCSERYVYTRGLNPKEVVKTIAEILNIASTDMIHIKYCHKTTEYRILRVFFMRCLCDCSYREICKYIGNITLSQAARLCERGYALMMEKPRYQSLMSTFLQNLKVA